MGLTQSIPEGELIPEHPIQQGVADAPSRPTSPPHPSRSSLNPSSSRRSAFSYFLPISHPDIQHSHLNPTLEDVRRASNILSTKLPPELVVKILDEARYWAGCRTLIQKELWVTARAPSPRTLGAPRTWSNGQENDVVLIDGTEGEVWYLASEPIGCDETRAQSAAGTAGSGSMRRRDETVSETEIVSSQVGDERLEEEDKCWLRGLVIETLSKDQGWSDNRAAYGTYEHSYSWFEVSLFRNGKEVDNTRRSFQHNIHAGQYFKAHRNILGQGNELVRQAKVGDRVVIWVRAQYPGWQNLVREAAITLYTTPFPSQV